MVVKEEAVHRVPAAFYPLTYAHSSASSVTPSAANLGPR